MTLNLLGSSAGSEISLNLAPDTSSISTAVSSFVTAYNTLIADVNSQFTYNKSTNTAGTLSGDSTISALQSALLGATNYVGTSGSITSLSQLGITTNQDGTLSLNTGTLATAVSNSSSAGRHLLPGCIERWIRRVGHQHDRHLYRLYPGRLHHRPQEHQQ